MNDIRKSSQVSAVITAIIIWGLYSPPKYILIQNIWFSQFIFKFIIIILLFFMIFRYDLLWKKHSRKNELRKCYKNIWIQINKSETSIDPKVRNVQNKIVL